MAKNKKNKDKPESKNTKSLPKPQLNLASETKRGIMVVVFVILAGITGLSILGAAGGLGGLIYKLFSLLFGVIAYLVPVMFLATAALLFRFQAPSEEQTDHPYFRTYLGMFLIAGSAAGVIHSLYIKDGVSALSIASEGRAGGYLGALFAGPLVGSLGFWAGDLALIGLFIIGLLITFNISPFRKFDKKVEEVKPGEKVTINNMNTEGFVKETVVDKNKALPPTEPLQQKINISQNKPSAGDDAISKMESITLEDRRDWKLPPFDLLDDNKTEVDSGDIESNVAIIQKTLADFGIEVEMGEVNVGPTVTQYTLRPATGVKLSQIGGLQNDLALALAAHSIRMELPIPGKALVGIEVPNKSTAIVRLREVMQTTDFVNHKSKLALALGRDVAGRPNVTDLSKMPHLLIAGATGTGKSVAINSLLISLLYRNTPQDIKFILVDPKRVELNLYNGIPHLLTPSITEPDKAVNALKWAVAEMERRYKMLADAGKRNLAEYNEGTELKVPFIVIVVDELADLMSVAQQDVEATIVRLAQMARAVGIHLVLATQRPSVEVITGLIKANITSRVAFAVASQIDSRTILDSSGAEKLLGNGDMLFISAEFTKPRRIQGAYLGEKEVKKVVDFFKSQTGAVIYNEEVIEKPKRALGLPGMSGDGDVDDDLYEAARDEVTRAGKASASLLQRRLRVGYARAARLLDILEEKGVIGPGEGAKPREVYGIVPADEKAEYGVEQDDDIPEM
jgi:DNA segregation ATPase FtsK/SpoIIIE, S-DNA-T family